MPASNEKKSNEIPPHAENQGNLGELLASALATGRGQGNGKEKKGAASEKKKTGGSAPSMGRPALLRAIQDRDEKTLQRWINEGGNLFETDLTPPFTSSKAWPALNGLGRIAMASGPGRGAGWASFLKKNEKKIRAMSGFDPNCALILRNASGLARRITPSNSTTPLHLAAQNADLAMVDWLLDLGADLDRSALDGSRFLAEKEGARTAPPLASAGTPETAFLLLERGASAQGEAWGDGTRNENATR